ncbi:DUF3552 domain-containing protein, partial [Candidatus Gracilibacteria bacterium]|nr:DUF3552 domain-containing protein [Candidatus Gracilibacteria bacterium]
MEPITIILIVVGLVVGTAAGFFYRKYHVEVQNREAIERAARVVKDAEAKARETILEAKQEAFKLVDEAKQEERSKRQHLEKLS